MPSSGVQTCADRKSTRLNSSHTIISYAVFCLKKKNKYTIATTNGPIHYITSVHRDTRMREQTNAVSLDCVVLQRATCGVLVCVFFFFNNGAPPEISPLPLPPLLPI